MSVCERFLFILNITRLNYLKFEQKFMFLFCRKSFLLKVNMKVKRFKTSEVFLFYFIFFQNIEFAPILLATSPGLIREHGQDNVYFYLISNVEFLLANLLSFFASTFT